MHFQTTDDTITINAEDIPGEEKKVHVSIISEGHVLDFKGNPADLVEGVVELAEFVSARAKGRERTVLPWMLDMAKNPLADEAIKAMCGGKPMHRLNANERGQVKVGMARIERGLDPVTGKKPKKAAPAPAPAPAPKKAKSGKGVGSAPPGDAS